jgi:CheY-like chemotaxis protein
MAKDKGKNASAEAKTAQPVPSSDSGQEAALHVKTQLIDNLAYQIRTLSNAIIGFSNLLGTEDLTDTQREYVNEIHQAGRGLSCIVNDVLDLARIESGNLRPDYAECDLAELLEDIEDTIARAAARKGLDFNIIPSETLPARIHTDPVRLKRCLLNLAGNAIQYTNRGYVHIMIRLEVDQPLPMIRFDIVDTGVGIDPGHLQTIFDPIPKTGRINSGMLASIHLGVQGCGLLSITRRLVELLGGRVEVTSEAGVGSTFSILLPVGLDVHSQPALVYPPGPEYLQESAEGREEKQCVGHVLLVEDEESNRTVLSLMLENLGLEVTTASGGRQAVSAVREKTFDAILMDIQLPDMSGYEVTRQLRQMGLAAPVIALSAGVLSDADDQQISELFNAFLAKPVDGPQLAGALELFLPTIRKETLTADPAARNTQ